MSSFGTANSRVPSVLFFQTSRFIFLLVGLVGLSFLLPLELSAEQPEGQRSIGDYRRDVKTFMKLSKSDDKPTQRNAIFNLCALHYELVKDSRFRTSTQVQSFRVVVAGRLEAYSKDHSKELKKQKAAQLKRERLARKHQRSDSSQQELSSASSVEVADQAQEETIDQDEAIYQSALQSYDSLSQLSGGPAQVFDYAAPRMGAPWDNGALLVNLIQNTIDPDVWRDNGGNASIHYYQPGRVLVINASQKTHEKTEDLLWKLRRLN